MDSAPPVEGPASIAAAARPASLTLSSPGPTPVAPVDGASSAGLYDQDADPAQRKRAYVFVRFQSHCPEGEELALPSAMPPIPGLRYMTCQMEMCPTTHQKHIQGMLVFTSLKTVRQIISIWKCSLRTCWGIPGAITYCQKERTRIPGTTHVEFGDKPAQGKRTDLPEFVALVRSGKRERDLIETHVGIIARYPRFYKKIKELYTPPRPKPKVMLLVGTTGTGKSTLARELAGGDPDEYYVVPKTKTGWFNGYDGQKYVIFDDFCGHLPLLKLLEILDPWPVRLEVKGSFTWFTAEYLIFTSNYHPNEWYNYDASEDGSKKDRTESKYALYRRFHRVLEFTSFGEYTTHDTTWSPDCDTSVIPYFPYY